MHRIYYKLVTLGLINLVAWNLSAADVVYGVNFNCAILSLSPQADKTIVYAFSDFLSITAVSHMAGDLDNDSEIGESKYACASTINTFRVNYTYESPNNINSSNSFLYDFLWEKRISPLRV